MTTVVSMVWKRVEDIKKIQLAIGSVRTKVGHSVMRICTELEKVNVSYRYRETVCRYRNWLAQSPSKNKILLAFAVTGKAKVSQLHIINVIESDSRYTIPDITKDVGLSLSRVHFILKRILNVRKISAIWILHILTDDQNGYEYETSLYC